MYNKLNFIKSWGMIGIAVLTLFACKTNRVSLVEPAKDISGSWQVSKVVQNGEDIGQYADLSTFRIKFNKDKTYSLTGKLPFIVSKDGTWSFNDPQYPFALYFTAKDDKTPIVSTLNFPIVGNKYQIGINFIIGCDNVYKNTYQYTLSQVTE